MKSFMNQKNIRKTIFFSKPFDNYKTENILKKYIFISFLLALIFLSVIN